MRISREEEANLQRQLTLDDDEALHALLKRLMPEQPLDAVKHLGTLWKMWPSDKVQLTRVVAGKKIVQVLRLKPKRKRESRTRSQTKESSLTSAGQQLSFSMDEK
jgi:hypothetical protein